LVLLDKYIHANVYFIREAELIHMIWNKELIIRIRTYIIMALGRHVWKSVATISRGALTTTNISRIGK
jgi:hypothetical protein